MDERARRVGRNESLFRAVNEELEGLERSVAAVADETLHIVCECGDLGCNERVVVPVRRYESVRAEPTLFFVVPGHEIAAYEDVVEATPGYNVVKKTGEAGRGLAEGTDPRA